MSDVEPGDLVVCLTDYWRNAKTGQPTNEFAECPRKGQIYTVRRIVLDGGLVGIRLEEIINPPQDGGLQEPAFDVRWFRKIVKPSIEVFRRIAASPKESVLI